MGWLNWLLGFLFLVSILEAWRWENDRKYSEVMFKRLEEEARKRKYGE